MKLRRFILMALFLCVATLAWAQVGEFGPRQDKVRGVVLRCTVICVPCELQKLYGAGGHETNAPHGIGVKTAESLIFTLLPGAASKPLTDPKWIGKQIDLNALTFPKTMAIEVLRYKEIDAENPQVRQLMYYCHV